ncbi:hypothetical protein FQA39_LY02845 [Lamprigera yunnana]|nr:hypothetical protein FQA39_LY02845 [Lamprigera yunnana]
MSLVQESFTKESLEKILKKCMKDIAMVLNVKVTGIAELGENYMSEILKILVSYSTSSGGDNKEMSIFVKCLKDDKGTIAMDKEYSMFDKEFCIYGEIFPTMTKMGDYYSICLCKTKFIILHLKSDKYAIMYLLEPSFKQKIGPFGYSISKDPTSMIFLEDMSAVGYKMQNRQEGLDLEQCLMVVKKLAYFHSASVALQEKQPEIMNIFYNGPYNDSATLRAFFSISYAELIRVLLDIPGLEKYSNNMPTVEYMYKKFISIAKRSNTLNVLMHGDLWCNNILFQYQGNEVTDAVFVDYQLSTFGSPFIDLHCFFSSSVKLENKVETITTLLNCYLDELLSNLKMLNVNKLPCREELLKDFKECAIIGFGRMCYALPFFKANKQKNGTLSNYIEKGGKDSFRCNSFNNPIYLKEVQQLFPFYDSLGVFD